MKVTVIENGECARSSLEVAIATPPAKFATDVGEELTEKIVKLDEAYSNKVMDEDLYEVQKSRLLQQWRRAKECSRSF